MWEVKQVRCPICNHEWVSVAPLEAPALECSGCGYMVPHSHDPEKDSILLNTDE